MDRKKLLRSIVWSNLFLGNCLFHTRTQATDDEVTDDFLRHVSDESPENVKYLRREITEFGEPKDKLYWAIRFENMPIIEHLLQKGVDLNRVIPPSRAQHENEGETPLEQAIGNPRLVKLFLNHGANPNLKRIDQYGDEITPLGKAVKEGEVKTVKLLLKRKANPHWKDLQNRTLLHEAISRSCISRRAMSIVKTLLDLGLDPNGRDDADRVPLTGLMESILMDTDIRHYRTCELDELEYEGLSQDLIHGHKGSIESISQDISCSLQILKLFVNRSADINAQDNEGNTLLHWAIPFTWHDKEIPTRLYSLNTHPNLELFQTLIELGADVNLPNNAGDTPLDLLIQRKEELCYDNDALANEYDRIIEFLRENGAIAGHPEDEIESQPQEKNETEDESEKEEKTEDSEIEDEAEDSEN
jgi:ankyrin repeat protein